VRSQPVEFLEFVERDLRYAHAYYGSCKTEGAEWLQERFRETISWVEWNPELFPKKYRRFRRAIIRRMYFGVFLAIEPKVTTVVAVLDLRRDPRACQPPQPCPANCNGRNQRVKKSSRSTTTFTWFC
jgi:hypothetical protein